MDLPQSSLLGRLQAFLPEMEKANKATERLAAEGRLDVIDANLEVATDEQREDGGREETDNEQEDEEEEEEEGAEVGAEGAASGAGGRTVQLDFALGDFDDNPIARMEAAKEEVDGNGAMAVESTDAMDRDGGDEGEDDNRGTNAGVAALLGASDEKSIARRKDQQKPLIEEL